MSAPATAAASPRLAPGRSVAPHPGQEDPEPDRQADGQHRQQLVVERDARHRRQHDEDAEEPATEPEHDRVQRPEHGAALASVATAATHAERHPEQREDGQRRQPEHDAEHDPRNRAVAERRREVDRRLRVEGRIDPAAVEVRVDQTGAGLRLVGPEVVRVAEVLEHDLLAVRQMRQQLAARPLRRRREVELAADQQRLDVRVANLRVLVLVRVRRPGVEQPTAGPDQVGAGAAEDRPACRRRSRRTAGRGRRRSWRRRRRRPRPARSGRPPAPSARGTTRRRRRPARRRAACRSSTAPQAARRRRWSRPSGRRTQPP